MRAERSSASIPTLSRRYPITDAYDTRGGSYGSPPALSCVLSPILGESGKWRLLLMAQDRSFAVPDVNVRNGVESGLAAFEALTPAYRQKRTERPALLQAWTAR